MRIIYRIYVVWYTFACIELVLFLKSNSIFELAVRILEQWNHSYGQASQTLPESLANLIIFDPL